MLFTMYLVSLLIFDFTVYYFWELIYLNVKYSVSGKNGTAL